MMRNRNTHLLWRGLVGCVVAYALVINAILAGVLGAEAVAGAAAGLVAPHCQTDAQAAPPRSDEPPAEHSDPSHCAFCPVAAPPAVLPDALATATIVPHPAGAPAGMSDRDRPYAPGHPGKLPRGPPQRS